MGKTIFLLRHAKSDWNDPALSDHDRPLNQRGQNAANKMAAVFKSIALKPDLVICSTAVRARETLEHVIPGLPQSTAVEYRRNSYLASPRTLLKTLNAVHDDYQSAMLVGHNPGTEELAEALIADGHPDAMRAMLTKYPTAALTVIHADVNNWKGLTFRANKLLAFIRPRFIKEDMEIADLS
jgi:phosphohistidine phosphatase